MRRRLVAVVAAVLVGAAGAVAVVALSGGGSSPSPVGRVPPSGPAAALPAPSTQEFGVNVNRLFNDLSYSQAQIDAQLAAVRATGATVARSDALWEAAEPHAPVGGEHRYSWGFDDQIAGSLARAGLTWLPIIDYSAPWAGSVSGDWRSAPSSSAQYAAFAAAIAARYGARGSFWAQYPQLPYEPVQTYEIWNEENGNYFWDNGPNPAVYAELYLAARAAIRAVDPLAQVAIGGLTNPRQGMSALAFLSGMFRAVPGLAGNVDAVGIHPYAANAAGTVQFVVAVRQLLDSLGESAVPIDVTEFGWQTGSAAAEQQRAANMSAVAQALGNSNCGIALLAPYDWQDPSYITNGDWGLTGADGMRSAGTAWFGGLAGGATGSVNQLCPAVGVPTGGTTAAGANPAAPTTAPAAGSPSATSASSTAPAHVATTSGAQATPSHAVTSTPSRKVTPSRKPAAKPKPKPAAKGKVTPRASKRAARVAARRRSIPARPCRCDTARSLTL